MATQRLLNSSAMRKQHLLVEFSGLKTACPHGVFMSLTPGDPTLWAGIIFVRKGPYAPSVLRFQISFPSSYPSLPPLVTFSTDIFHPLITPLTTYMYTTDIQDSGTVSATDNERLPPGGFSLRHGFPGWFGRASKTTGGSRVTSGGSQVLQTPVKSMSPGGGTSATETGTPDSGGSSIIQNAGGMKGGRFGPPSTYDVLRYLRSTFDDEEVLDSVPLEAAGNPGAWHAWRTHRAKTMKESALYEAPNEDEGNARGAKVETAMVSPSPSVTRKPGEWNWDGVWEVRSKKGIEASLTDPVLYGNMASSDDLIRFLQVDDDQLETIKENMQRSMGTV